jgi:hypothetical protein
MDGGEMVVEGGEWCIVMDGGEMFGRLTLLSCKQCYDGRL